MAWVKIDDRYAEHPKVVQAGPLGSAMFVAGLCYCNQYLTDGFIPRGKVPGLIDLSGFPVTWEQVARRLVEVGLWEETAGGYHVHDYEKYQPSKEDVIREHQQKSNAGRKGAQARWQERQRDEDGTCHDTCHGTCHSNRHGRAIAEPVAKSCPGPDPVPNIDKDIETPPYSPPAVDNPEVEEAVATEEGEDDLYSGLMRTVGDRDIGLDQEAFDGLVAAMRAHGMPVEVADVAADLTVELCREPAARGAYFQRVIGSWLGRGIVTVPAAERDAARAREKAKLRAGPPRTRSGTTARGAR